MGPGQPSRCEHLHDNPLVEIRVSFSWMNAEMDIARPLGSGWSEWLCHLPHLLQR